MFCTQCGHRLAEQDVFCSQCGIGRSSETASHPPDAPPRLDRGHVLLPKVGSTVGHVLDTLRNARGCTLLIGAGCSLSAGIPLASGFVAKIEEMYPAHFRSAQEIGTTAQPTYAECMAQLSPSQQRDLISKYVDRAQINWAHIAIAQLMKYGHVDRILTTNFDPLVVRACALVGDFPAVYDLAASQLFHPEKVPEKAVFYLHGQRTGFALVNTRPDGEKQAKHLAPVFEDAGHERMWIVAGYSGESDPVFTTLSKIPRFDYPLYWIGYRREDPPPHVKEKLLGPNRHAFYVNSDGADEFFIEIAKQLGCFPPEFVGRPFSHLDTLLRSLTPFPLLGQDQAAEYDTRPRELIRAAIRQYEEAPDEGAKPADESVTSEGTADFSAETLEATTALMVGDYERVLALQPEHGRTMPAELADSISWAYVMQGNELKAQAGRQQGEKADQLFAQAEEKYAAALEIEPDKHEALNNWGSALAMQAERQQGEKADQLLAQAAGKLAAALEIKPDAHKVLNNWGGLLQLQAKRQQGEKADQLFAQAEEKYAAALEIKPDAHEALNNWGGVLLVQSACKTGVEAERLRKEAEKRLLEAEKIAAGSAAYNLACVAALRGNTHACREWLEAAIKHDSLPSRAHLESDSDLDSVHNEAWFQEILSSAD